MIPTVPTFKKYRLDENDTIEKILNGKKITLYRIICIKEDTEIPFNTKGGYIDKESTLSHVGKCWIDLNSIVMGGVKVRDDVQIVRSELCGDIIIEGNVIVEDEVIVNLPEYKIPRKPMENTLVISK